jgi:hypothetical protein
MSGLPWVNGLFRCFKIFVNSSWAHFAKIQTDIYLDIVRESYANLTLKKDNSLLNLSCHKYD